MRTKGGLGDLSAVAPRAKAEAVTRRRREGRGRVGKANGSRECAPDDKLRVPTTLRASEQR
jgi:hypothetical protein